MSYWWLSFVEDEKFLGACVVEARDIMTAARVAWAHCCNPGGQVAGIEIPENHPFPVNLLMTKDDIELFQESPARSVGDALVEALGIGGEK